MSYCGGAKHLGKARKEVMHMTQVNGRALQEGDELELDHDSGSHLLRDGVSVPIQAGTWFQMHGIGQETRIVRWDDNQYLVDEENHIVVLRDVPAGTCFVVLSYPETEELLKSEDKQKAA